MARGWPRDSLATGRVRVTSPMDIAERMVSTWEAQLATTHTPGSTPGDYTVQITMTPDVKNRMVLDITVQLNEAIRREHG